MKDFSSFVNQLIQSPDFTKRLAEQVKNLSGEQTQDVARILLTVLREYDEWRQS